MERSSSEKFWKGNGNDVLSATEGNTESRGWGGICDWREGEKISRSRYDRVQAREAHFAKGNESGASLSWLALNRDAPAHKQPSDMYSSRPVSAASSLPSVFSPTGVH
jgi:hypothetical protein